MKFFTRKEFADSSKRLSRMRRNDPIQFEVLFVMHCRENKLNHYSKGV